MSYDDLEAVARLVESEEEQEKVRQITNKLAKQTLRGGLSAYWWLPLARVGYPGIDAASEADTKMLSAG